MNEMTIFFLCVIGVALFYLVFYLWGQQKGNKTKYNDKKGLVTVLSVVLIVGLTASPIFPWTDGWLWGLLGGETEPYNPPTSDGSYLDFNGEQEHSNTGITFDVINRADEDGGYADTSADAITVRVYSGTTSAGDLSHQLFEKGQISWNEYLWLANMEGNSISYIETLTCSSGTATSTKNVYSSKDELTLMFGTYDAAEDGDNPLKTWIAQGVVQGETATSKPSALSVGLGYFEYFPSPDEDDLTFDIVDKDYQDYSESTSFDWSDDGDDIIEMKAKIVFTDAEFGLYSYYDYANERWNHWYIAGYTSEDNCTTTEGMSIDSTLPSGYSATTNQVNFYVKLTSGNIWTGPVSSITDTTDFGYFTDTAGDEYSGYDDTFFVDVDFDLLSCTSGGSSDNDREFQIFWDFGTGYDETRILNSGQLITDTDNNYNVACNDSPYVIA